MTKVQFAAVVVLGLFGVAFVQGQERHPLQDAATGKLTASTITMTGPAGQKIIRTLPFFSSGILNTVHDAMNEAAGQRTAAALAGHAEAMASVAAPWNFSDWGLTSSAALDRTTVGCGNRDQDRNTRVNQDCSYRRQAEEKIVFNPVNPFNLLAGMNDSRVGFNQNAIAFSVDNGQHWGDLLPPFREKLNDPSSDGPIPGDPNTNTILGGPGTLHTYDFCSDPGPTFDSQGRGFYSCVALDINSNAAMLFATQSPKGAQGSFFLNVSGRAFVVVEDNNPDVTHDKPFIAADPYVNSPNRDNVYATWTVFRFGTSCTGGFCSSPIFGSMSTDHGLTWSTPEEISGTSTTLCFMGNLFDPTRSPNACDFDQGSDPQPQPNGNLVVIFNNGNTPSGNSNSQQLAVVCQPSGSSTAGSAHLNCGTPSKVGDDITLNEPTCDFGRGPEECVPGPFIRTNDFPRIGFNPFNRHVYATWQDYRNGEYDIQLAESTDGGFTWAPSVTVNPDTGLDHYFAAVAVARTTDFDRVGVSYYRSGRVPSETTPGPFAVGQPGVQEENSDYVLAGGKALAAPFRFTVVSPVFPPPDGIQAGFNGDYSGLTVNQGTQAHPIWSDTRNADPFAPLDGVTHDEDVFTDSLNLPHGQANPSTGQLGQGDGGGHNW